uniref:Uncharacterized protein n=1 Tax=Globodera rostochiensis TaxID=31243 RepID=A0A914GW45_GLORO
MPICIFRVQPNSLLSLWYTVGCTLLHSWLLYLGFVRYRLYMDMQWPTGGFPRIWLTTYISLLGTCIPLLALFLAFGLLKSGNLAGDNEQLGARPKRTIELVKGGMGKTAVRLRNTNAHRLCHCLRSAWLHCPPAAQGLHVLLALLQLFAQQTMLAQLYRWGFINSGDFLSTELDWIFQRARQLATNLPMGETRLQSFRISTEELAASPVAPNILPILMHTRLFGIPLEFVNLLIALIAFSSAYPAVFWRVSKPFALLFSAFMGVHSLCLTWTYLGFSVLFRVQETNFYGGRPVGMGQHLWALRSLTLYHPLAIVAAFWLTVALMHIAPIALYSFGYGKFAATQNRLFRLRRFSVPPSSSEVGGCQMRSVGMNGWSYDREIICDGYTPHVVAILLLLTIAAVKAPAFYAIGLIYQKEERPFLLWCLVADLVYLFSWILLWLLYTVKCRWDFLVHYDAHELIALQDAHKTADGHTLRGRGPGELKGALLLVHGSDMFITDDPVAKPAIMRQVLRSCLPLEDLPTWLRAVPLQNSMPNTQSPQRRFMRADNNPLGMPDGGGCLPEAFRTPDLGLHHRQLQQQISADSESPMEVPLAAPPYQRMASLPPMLPAAGHQQQQQPGTSFGTLQRSQPHQNVVTLGGNDYTAFVRSNGQPYQQHQQQQQQAMFVQHHHQQQIQQPMVNIGTLSRSYNAGGQQHAPPPQVLTATTTTAAPQHYGHIMPSAMLHQPGMESYATINRRCSKSSVSSSATGFGSSAAPLMPSPQLLRPRRSASVATREQQNAAVQRHNHQQHQQQQQNGNDVYGQQHNIYGQFNGAGTGTMQRNGGGQQQKFQHFLNGAEPPPPPKPKLLTPMLQRHRPPLATSTFAGSSWQTTPTERNNAAAAAAVVAENSAGTSMNGGGTTPSSSVTIGGDSRVASAASNASSTVHATFGDIGTLNGGVAFGHGADAQGAVPTTTDCATLTRDSQKGQAVADEWRGRNGRDPSLEGGSGTASMAAAGGQMTVPKGGGAERFATSVV